MEVIQIFSNLHLCATLEKFMVCLNLWCFLTFYNIVTFKF